MLYPASDGRVGPYTPAVATSAASAPVFVPGQPQGTAYMVAFPPPTAPPQQPAGQGGTTFAQESNGMVYYYDASQVYNAGGFAPASYGVTPTGEVMSMGGVMTPGNPEGYFYPHPGQGTVYYSQ